MKGVGRCIAEQHRRLPLGSPSTLNVGFGEIVDLKKEDAEKVYQEGYEKGEAVGKETGIVYG